MRFLLRGKPLLQQHDLKDAVSDPELAHSIDPASASAAYNPASCILLPRQAGSEANSLSS